MGRRTRIMTSHDSSNYDNSGFWRWLCDELADEAHQARRSGGRMPARPVRLSEVEAVGLMILALAAHQQERAGGLAADAARCLVDTLQGRLDRLSADHSEGWAT